MVKEWRWARAQTPCFFWGLCVPGSKAEAKGPASVSSAGVWLPSPYPQHTPGSLHENVNEKKCGSREGGEKRRGKEVWGFVMVKGKAHLDSCDPHCLSPALQRKG